MGRVVACSNASATSVPCEMERRLVRTCSEHRPHCFDADVVLLSAFFAASSKETPRGGRSGDDARPWDTNTAVKSVTRAILTRKP